MISFSLFVLFSQFERVTDLFSSPIPSSRLSIYKVKNECNILQSISLKNIVCKYVCWPENGDSSSHIIIPMLH